VDAQRSKAQARHALLDNQDDGKGIDPARAERTRHHTRRDFRCNTRDMYRMLESGENVVLGHASEKVRCTIFDRSLGMIARHDQCIEAMLGRF
jgi:hypothetical protein